MMQSSHSGAVRPQTYPGTMDLSLSSRMVAGDVVVEVCGEIDVGSSQRLREALVAMIHEGGPRLIVDLDKVELIDSTGLGVLVGVLKKVRDRDGSLTLVCSNDGLLRVFELTGLTKVFVIQSTVAAATGDAPV